MTLPLPLSITAKQTARRLIRVLLGGRLHDPTLALLRHGVRSFPRFRLATALAFYAGEALAERPGELVGRLRTGSPINLFPADYMHRHIYFYGEYERSTTLFLRSIARRGWTFLDVGANAGYFSLLAHDLGGPESSIHAFEPNPRLAGLLERSVSATGTVRVVRMACGDHPGTADLHLSPEAGNSGLSTLRTDVLDATAGQITVKVVTLDDYCQRNRLAPEVIKVDVEGHEIAVLHGAHRVLSARGPSHVICELAPERCAAGPLIATMAEYGYEPRSLTAGGFLTAFHESGLQNVVFLRPT